MSGKLAPIGLSPEEVTLLTSIIAIVAIRTDMRWQLGSIDDSNVYFVNSDCREGESFIERYGSTVAILKYSSRSAKDDIFSLKKPLRARDLFKALEFVGVQNIYASRQA